MKVRGQRWQDVVDELFQVDCFRIQRFDNPTTNWIDLPVDSGTFFNTLGEGYLTGLLLRAEGIPDAMYCVAGYRVDGRPSVGYYEWPSGGMTPSWLNDVEGQSNALGSHTPYKLIKCDLTNNQFVVWADFPYPGISYSQSFQIGARLTQRTSSGGNLFVWVAAYYVTRRSRQHFA